MDQPDGAPPATPVSVALQVEEPWSNSQLCPPTAATGNPAMPLPFNATVLGPTAELLFSKLELSGTKTDPAVPVNMFGDMFASDGATILSVEYTNPWFPAGKVVPSEHTAHAKFCVRKRTGNRNRGNSADALTRDGLCSHIRPHANSVVISNDHIRLNSRCQKSPQEPTWKAPLQCRSRVQNFFRSSALPRSPRS